jgi:signal transduction histidine kinase
VKLRSLRARLIAGAVFWTVGILIAASTIGFAIVRVHPRLGLFVHYGMLTLAGATVASAGISVIRSGLSPFRLLRERLAAVRDGSTARLEGEYPTEVQPLVDDLNGLLDEREQRIGRAMAKAGDLAHGLKTPLAILAQDVESAAAAGQPELASSIRVQVERMRRQIETHLAHARVTASGTAPGRRASVADAARALVRTMERLYADRALSITIGASPDADVRVALEDLEEMLGNLLDNACQWSRAQVAVNWSAAGGDVVVFVEDDGPGLAPAMREKVLQRGVRADERAPGSGLGLAIVRDLAEAYGGTISLGSSLRGGLRATLRLPAA